MIYLLTGVGGSGKTLYAVSEIERLLKENRIVYTDINGIDFQSDDVIKIPPFIDGDVESSYHDFRTLPPGSVVIYDEAQKRFPSTGKSGKTRFPCIEALDTHRHDGYDIYYITQEPTLIDSTLRKFVYRHFHFETKLGLNYSTIYMKENGVLDHKDKSDRRSAQAQMFKHPKHLFDKYKSASIHTKKRLMIPKKVIFFILAMGGLSYWVMSNFKDSTILESATGVMKGDIVSSKQFKKGEQDSEYVEPIEKKYDEDGYQYTSYFDNTLHMAIIGYIGTDVYIEIGKPPESYQTSLRKLALAGATVELVSKCLLLMEYQGSKYRVTCPLHSRQFDYQFEDEPETNNNFYDQLTKSG